MESDGDDDLLELAGVGDSSEGKVRVGREGSDEPLDDEFVNPYPLEGKYKNEVDQAHLLSLTEVQREERQYLAQRERERRQAKRDLLELEDKRASREDKNSKKSRLHELKRRREEKSNRQSARKGQGEQVAGGNNHQEQGGGGDDENDDENDDDDEENEHSRSKHTRHRSESVEWADDYYKRSGDRGDELEFKEASVNDLNKTKFGRTTLAKFCHYPEFETVICGCFVRVNIGYDKAKQVATYRVCQVKDVSRLPAGKTYEFLNRTVDFTLLVSHGANEKCFEMGVCSDGPITDEEFDWWKRSMAKTNQPLPTKRRIDRKFRELVELRDRKLTSSEINEIVKKRQALSHRAIGVNMVAEKSMLQQELIAARVDGDVERARKAEEALAKIESRLSQNKREFSKQDAVAAVNERNRRANQLEIRKAELRAHEERKLQAFNQKDSADPFSRLRTSARIYHNTHVSTESPRDALETDKKPAIEAGSTSPIATSSTTSSNTSTSRLDEAIAQIDIQIDI